MSPIYRLHGTEKSSKQFLILMVIVMNKGLSSVMFWNQHAVYTGNFAYPRSFGY